MNTSRLEAFSDGVIAILITIMVLELHAPAEASFAALSPLLPVILSYILSFIYLGIYWNNHHHMLQVTERVSGGVLWANLFLLFWLSLVPFVTAWMGRTHFAATPTACYGVVLLMAALSYTLLQNRIVAIEGKESVLARAVGADRKGRISLGAYVLAIGASFWDPRISDALYVLVALIWLVPDPRIERVVAETSPSARP